MNDHVYPLHFSQIRIKADFMNIHFVHTYEFEFLKLHTFVFSYLHTLVSENFTLYNSNFHTFSEKQHKKRANFLGHLQKMLNFFEKSVKKSQLITKKGKCAIFKNEIHKFTNLCSEIHIISSAANENVLET